MSTLVTINNPEAFRENIRNKLIPLLGDDILALNLEKGIYNYCLNTNPYELQPSGAINLSKFKTIELEFETHLPPFDNASEYFSICDNEGNIVGNTKNSNLYIYSYDLTLIEERYNIVRFVSGQAGLVYTR